MKSVFEEKGRFELIIGKGYLSAFEVNELAAGDVVQVSHEAGTPFDVLFNGAYACTGEIIVFGDTFGIRLTHASGEEETAPAPGVTDDVVEILPTRIGLAGIRVSLAEMEGIAAGTLVHLGKKIDEDVELIVAGIPVASGRVVVTSLNERMGLRITKVYGRKADGIGVRVSGFHFDSSAIDFRVKDYDFCRPDKFTKAGVLKTHNVHETFLMNLRAASGEMRNLRVSDVDQLTIREAFEALGPDRRFLLVDVSLDRAGGRRVREGKGPSGRKEQKYFLAEEGAEIPGGPDRLKSFVEWMKAGGTEQNRKILIAFGAESPFAAFEGEAAVNEILLASLRNGWKNVADVGFKLSRRAAGPEEAKVVPDNDLVLAVKIAGGGDAEKGCTIIYPYAAIEPIIPLLK